MRALIAILLVLLSTIPAVAQSTGGSFGGRSSSWGRSSSSSSSFGSSRSSSSSFGSSRSSDFGSSRSSFGSSSSSRSSDIYGGTSSGPSGPSPTQLWERERRDLGGPRVTDAERAARDRPDSPIPWWLGPGAIWVALMSLFLGGTWYVRRRRRRLDAGLGPLHFDAPSAIRTPIWLRRISIGFDWTAREDLQVRLAALATTLRLDTDRDRADAVRAVLALLREHHGAARYGLADVYALDDVMGPEKLDRLALDLRARFTAETRGARANAADVDVRPHADEGPGMLVVTLLFASYAELPDVELTDRASTFVALAAEPGLEVPGVDVIWSPAEPDDRMSSHELERFYPELRRMDDAGAVGSVGCAHCGAPRPAELGACPACGAPGS